MNSIAIFIFQKRKHNAVNISHFDGESINHMQSMPPISNASEPGYTTDATNPTEPSTSRLNSWAINTQMREEPEEHNDSVYSDDSSESSEEDSHSGTGTDYEPDEDQSCWVELDNMV